MARFTNQATLSYNGSVVNSNLAVGEILEALSAQKTAVRETYVSGAYITNTATITGEGIPAITAQDTDYTYDAAGNFATAAGKLVVETAAYAQDTQTGAWVVTPGTSTLIVSGTIA